MLCHSIRESLSPSILAFPPLAVLPYESVPMSGTESGNKTFVARVRATIFLTLRDLIPLAMAPTGCQRELDRTGFHSKVVDLVPLSPVLSIRVYPRDRFAFPENCRRPFGDKPPRP